MKKLLFDIDGVICTTNKSEHHKSKPKKNNKIINSLFENGYEIKILQQDTWVEVQKM